MEQYNPYIATFRVPPALNKIDIKGYLKAVYNLDTTFVHTSINHKTRFKAQNGAGAWQNGKSKDNFKRAVVGLTKPFYYPNDPLGMTLEERKSYEERLDADFMVKEYKVQEVIQRRRQFANVRNRPGLSERSAKIYPTKPAAALKCVGSRLPWAGDDRADVFLGRLSPPLALTAGTPRRLRPRRQTPSGWRSPRRSARSVRSLGRRPRSRQRRARTPRQRTTGAAGARSPCPPDRDSSPRLGRAFPTADRPRRQGTDPLLTPR